MCYSLWVSLGVSIIMFILIGIYWKIFVKKNPKELSNFFKVTLIAILFIAGHEFFQFLSLYFSSEIIFKIGLIISIIGMFFYMKSLESLTKYNFKSNYFIPIIMIIIAYIILTPMFFSSFSFWIKEENNYLWTFTWGGLFIYWNVCAIYVLEKIRSKKEKSTIKWYMFETMNISFIFALSYFLILNIGKSLNMFQNLPSIWCTFGIIQLIFYPNLFYRIKKYHLPKPIKHNISLKTQIKLITISIIFLLIFWKFVPLIPEFLKKLAFG